MNEPDSIVVWSPLEITMVAPQSVVESDFMLGPLAQLILRRYEPSAVSVFSKFGNVADHVHDPCSAWQVTILPPVSCPQY